MGAGEPRYRPIRDYAAVGDCHGTALVSRQGSVDWCWLRRFDANPVFCRLLDADQGGHFSIRPEGRFTSHRAYVDGTAILRTHFKTAAGEATVTDFMPVGRRPGAGVHDYVNLNAPFWLMRLVEGVRGEVMLAVDYAPSVDFARCPTRLFYAADRGIAAEGGAVFYSDTALEIVDGIRARGRLRLRAGGGRARSNCP